MTGPPTDVDAAIAAAFEDRRRLDRAIVASTVYPRALLNELNIVDARIHRLHMYKEHGIWEAA